MKSEYFANGGHTRLKRYSSVRQTRKRDAPNLLWIGRISFSGYASITANYLQAFARAGLNYVSIDSQSQKFIGTAATHFWQWDDARKTFTTSNDLLVVINEIPTFFDKVKVNGHARLIGCTLFETHAIPADWLNYLDLVEEIWIPTTFNLESFCKGGVPKEKLRVVPYCLDTDFYDTTVPALDIPGTRKFVFLYVITNWNRKDIGLLLRSYYQAFRHNKEVTLLLKVLKSYRDILSMIKESVKPEFDFDDPQLPHVMVMREDLSSERMRRLYQTCNVYVSTERGKGWDYPAMEAMAMGKPVVSIDWSGSTEFLRSDNSFLIPPKGRLIPIDKDLATNVPLYWGQMWPDVWEEDVVKALVKSYEREDLRSEFGAKGYEEVREKYSLEAVGKKIKDILHSYDETDYRGTGPARIEILPFKDNSESVENDGEQIKRLKEALNKKNEMIKIRDEGIKKLKEELNKKCATIKSKDEIIARNKEMIISLKNEVKKQKDAVLEKVRLIKKRDAKITRILGSKTYRVGRFMVSPLLKIKRVLENIK